MSRDHSEICASCGCARGGMERLTCECDAGFWGRTSARLLNENRQLREQFAERDAEIARLRGLEAMQRVLAWGGHEMPRPDIYARDMQCLAAARDALAEACRVLELRTDPEWPDYDEEIARIADLRKRGGI